jgi:hypothetical protein
MASASPADADRPRRPVDDRRGVAILAVLGVLVAGVALFTWRVVPPAIAPRINVRWAPDVSDARRAVAEQQFSLRRGELREGRTWAYDLADISRANIRALVANPAVEDTHYINRTAGTVWRTAPRGTIAVGGWLNRVRDSAAVSWAAMLSATTVAVSMLWLVTTGRRPGR